MPRGVYDRSKTKKTAAASETKPAEKKARAPWGSKKAAKAPSTVSETYATAKFEALSLSELANLRAAFSTPVNTVIIGKIDTLVIRQLDALIGAAAAQDEVKATKAAQAQAPVQMPAPIQATAPFNPSVPPNGQA